jgi:PST family polysaccharide transporter
VIKKKLIGLFKLIKRYRIIVENFGYLSLLQLFTTLVPLLVYPYLVKVLGSDLYGKVIFAQAIMMFFSVLIDYGFNISAVKEVAENKSDKYKLSEIVSSVIFIKLIIWIISFLILISLVFFFGKFSEDPTLFLFAFTITFNQLLFPRWFFQGIEKMRYITIVNITSKIVFLVLIFIIVKQKDDYLLVPLLNGFGAFTGGIIGLYFVIFKEGVKFKLPKLNVLKYYLKSGSSMFGFKIAGVIKTQFNQIILGLMSNYSLVAYYDLAMKITSVFSTVFNNYTAAFFPHIAKNKDINLGKKALKFSFLLSMSSYILIALILKPLIQTWNIEFLPTVKLFWILGLFIPIYAVASFLGNSILVSHGYQKQHFISTAWTTILYLIIIYALYVFNNITIYSLGITVLSVQLLSTLHKFYYGKKFKLL